MEPLKRILLVEDDPHDAELTMKALSDYNLVNEIKWVHDGEEALDFIFCHGPYEGTECDDLAVILLDLKMPKVDGLEVLQILKSDEQKKLIPVVILTSSREEQDMLKSYRLGVNAYVVKPVDFKEFIKAVKELGAFWAIVNEPPPLTRLPRS